MTTSTLIKNRRIATLQTPETGRGAVFVTDDHRQVTVEFSVDDYADMGSPSTITLTIEPGDQINDAETIEADLPQGVASDLPPFLDRRVSHVVRDA
ncbi:hypothetical protein AERO9AM_50031 [Aeromicrobium sp. 9AM]|nr:hypothetical protein AERO9AM_50031 [Aeromicrobium sp. 9AM]